jgi:hypothetical protein
MAKTHRCAATSTRFWFVAYGASTPQLLLGACLGPERKLRSSDAGPLQTAEASWIRQCGQASPETSVDPTVCSERAST